MKLDRTYCVYSEKAVKVAEKEYYTHIKKLDIVPDGKYLIMQSVAGREVSFRSNKPNDKTLTFVELYKNKFIKVTNKLRVIYNTKISDKEAGVTKLHVIIPVSVYKASTSLDCLHKQEVFECLTEADSDMPKYLFKSIYDTVLTVDSVETVSDDIPLGLERYEYQIELSELLNVNN